MLARIRLLLMLLASCVWCLCLTPILKAQSSRLDCAERKQADLPLPSTYLPGRLPEFQKVLTAFGVETNDCATLVPSSTMVPTAFILP
jgi:hypothetical protein